MPVEEDGDEVFTPMPTHCANLNCHNSPLVNRNGFMVCPSCNGSFGRASDPIALEPDGRWGRFLTFPAKVGTGPACCVLVRGKRKFYDGQNLHCRFQVGERVHYINERDLAGTSKGMTPRWHTGIIWKIEGDRLFIEMH